MEKVTSIPDYYKGKTILITGATGFIGKCLIEKLLRSCDGIAKIFVLLRCKKGKSVDERIEALKKEIVFQNLSPSSLQKLVGIESDLSSDTGIIFSHDATLQKDLQQVNVIFHCAASVRFDDPFKKAILINVCATKAMLDFAKTLKYLDVFMHVSTAYSNCDHAEIEEKIYPAYMDWRYVIKIAEKMSQCDLDAVYSKLSENIANTYVYTKNVAESMVKDYEGILPVLIYRPSIVTSAEKEPLLGWIGNFNGPVALYIAAGVGINRTMWVNSGARGDHVPVDLCVKGMIIATVKYAKFNEKNLVEVYNAASIKTDLSYEDSIPVMLEYVVPEYPLDNIFWRPGGKVTSCFYEYYIRVILLQLLPAILADSALKLMNKEQRFVKFQRLLIHGQIALRYFLARSWDIRNDNFIDLNQILLESEKNDFEIKETIPEVVEYLKVSVLAARRYLLNSPDAGLEKARKKLRYMVLLDNVLKYLILCGTAFYVYQKFY